MHAAAGPRTWPRGRAPAAATPGPPRRMELPRAAGCVDLAACREGDLRGIRRCEAHQPRGAALLLMAVVGSRRWRRRGMGRRPQAAHAARAWRHAHMHAAGWLSRSCPTSAGVSLTACAAQHEDAAWLGTCVLCACVRVCVCVCVCVSVCAPRARLLWVQYQSQQQQCHRQPTTKAGRSSALSWAPGHCMCAQAGGCMYSSRRHFDLAWSA